MRLKLNSLKTVELFRWKRTIQSVNLIELTWKLDLKFDFYNPIQLNLLKLLKWMRRKWPIKWVKLIELTWKLDSNWLLLSNSTEFDLKFNLIQWNELN